MRSRLVREGSVGLFFLLGVILFGGVIFFLKGRNFQNPEYEVKLLFENAGGLKEGAGVYYRGVSVGRVTAIKPSSNGVEISAEIDGSLRIPKDVRVSTLRSGLLGEVSINIVPLSDIPDIAKTMSPLDENCSQQEFIICDGQKITGTSYPDVVESLSLIADRINNEQFFEVIDETLVNVNKTAEQLTTLTGEATIVVGQLNSSLKTVSTTTEKIGKTADSLTTATDIASGQIQALGSSYTEAGEEANILINNLNQLIEENKNSVNETIANFSNTTAEISRVIKNTEQLLSQVNPDDVVTISSNLGTTSENLATLSQDLKQIAADLNDPTNLVTLQQTLDSARVTFANTAKITSDIDEFTGDPEFRNNLRKLIDGLGNLVSYSEILEKQIELATILQEFEQVRAKENNSIAIDKKLEINRELFPSAFSSSQKIKFKNDD